MKGAISIVKSNVPPTGFTEGKIVSQLDVVDYEPSEYRLVWRLVGYPSWILFCERTQVLKAVEGDPTKTIYENSEVFTGVLAYVVDWWMGRVMLETFTQVGGWLKDRVESS